MEFLWTFVSYDRIFKYSQLSCYGQYQESAQGNCGGYRTGKQVFYIIHTLLFHVYINCPNILWEWIPQLFMLHVGSNHQLSSYLHISCPTIALCILVVMLQTHHVQSELLWSWPPWPWWHRLFACGHVYELACPLWRLSVAYMHQ